MVPSGFGQETTGREASVPGADHNGVDVSHGVSSLGLLVTQAHRARPVGGVEAGALRGANAGSQATVTSMSIGTGLVSTSNTADRARDRSTSPRSFSGGASPAILKLTRIWL